MTGTPGFSFAPTFENAELGRRGGSPAEFPQGSVKVLNFKLPQTPSPHSVSPLVSQQPSGAFGAAVLQSVLQTVLGPEAVAALSQASPGASTRPSPAPMRSPAPSPAPVASPAVPSPSPAPTYQFEHRQPGVVERPPAGMPFGPPARDPGHELLEMLSGGDRDNQRRREIFEMGPDRAGADWERAGFARQAVPSTSTPRPRITVGDNPFGNPFDGGGLL